MDVAVAPLGLKGLRLLHHQVPAIAIAAVQLRHHSLDLQIVLAALVGLQSGDQLLHLAQGLLVLNGQQHPRFDKNQLGGHGDELAGYLQIHLLAFLHPDQILIQDQRDLNVPDLHLIFAQQVQDQIQGAYKVLPVLFFALHHPFQVVDGRLHRLPPLSAF